MSSVAYGQELISVEVNTDKLVEYMNEKDEAIRSLNKSLKNLRDINHRLRAQTNSKDALIDSMDVYRRRWFRVEELLAPRLVKKLKDEIL